MLLPVELGLGESIEFLDSGWMLVWDPVGRRARVEDAATREVFWHGPWGAGAKLERGELVLGESVAEARTPLPKSALELGSVPPAAASVALARQSLRRGLDPATTTSFHVTWPGGSLRMGTDGKFVARTVRGSGATEGLRVIVDSRLGLGAADCFGERAHIFSTSYLPAIAEQLVSLRLAAMADVGWEDDGLGVGSHAQGAAAPFRAILPLAAGVCVATGNGPPQLVVMRDGATRRQPVPAGSKAAHANWDGSVLIVDSTQRAAWVGLEGPPLFAPRGARWVGTSLHGQDALMAAGNELRILAATSQKWSAAIPLIGECGGAWSTEDVALVADTARGSPRTWVRRLSGCLWSWIAGRPIALSADHDTLVVERRGEVCMVSLRTGRGGPVGPWRWDDAGGLCAIEGSFFRGFSLPGAVEYEIGAGFTLLPRAHHFFSK